MPGPKILGQVIGDGTAKVAYTSPTTSGAGGTAVSTIAVVNDSDTQLSASISIVPAGVSVSGGIPAVHKLVPATKVAGRDVLMVQLGIGLAPGDRVMTDAAAALNVHVYGTEL